jgi:hypothetical protein
VATRRNVSNAAGKETADAIRQEVAREVEQLLRIIFRDRKTGSPVDLEAIALKRDCFATIETSIRFVMHHAGAGALTQLLQFGEPDADHSTVLVPVATWHATKNCAARPSSACWGQFRSGAPTTYARIAPKGNTPPTESWGMRRLQALVGPSAPSVKAAGP